MKNHQDCFDRGEHFFGAGQLHKALEQYDRAIALRPQHVGALYRKGETLYKLGRYLEAASAFWSAYLFLQSKKEPLLMCGRALSAADFPYEACELFGRVADAEIDDESCIFYIASLVQEMRILEAERLLPRIAYKQCYNARLVRGQVLQELGRYEEAQGNLEAIVDQAPKSHAHDRLLTVYTGLGLYDKIKPLLMDAAERFADYREHYQAMLAGCEILLKGQEISLAAYSNNRRRDIVEAALYLHSKKDGNLLFPGSCIETFARLTKKVLPAGLICEFGVRHGHSINHIGKFFPSHPVFGFDSFEGLPEAWHDEAAGSYSTGGRMPTVPENVTLVRGWFNETLPVFLEEHHEPVVLINVDCDLYSSTKTIFQFLGPRIIPGTIIVFDEYIGNPQWKEDEYKAFQEWVVANRVRYKYVAASLYTKQVAVEIIELSQGVA